MYFLIGSVVALIVSVYLSLVFDWKKSANYWRGDTQDLVMASFLTAVLSGLTIVIWPITIIMGMTYFGIQRREAKD